MPVCEKQTAKLNTDENFILVQFFFFFFLKYLLLHYFRILVSVSSWPFGKARACTTSTHLTLHELPCVPVWGLWAMWLNQFPELRRGMGRLAPVLCSSKQALQQPRLCHLIVLTDTCRLMRNQAYVFFSFLFFLLGVKSLLRGISNKSDVVTWEPG